MPKVSVVIPAYNRAHFLPETIKSVLAQSFHDFDITVIDDGSTDNTAEVVSAFPVRYFRQNNQGAPAARNKGMELTQSEYIVFLDSDDVLMENALQKGVEILDNNPEIGFSYGQSYLINKEGSVFGLKKQRCKHSYIREGWEEIGELVYGCHIPSPTVMIRRRCIDEVGGFNPAFAFGSQDFEMWVRLARRYAVGYIAEPLAKYRTHTNTMSTTRRLAEIEQSNSRILEAVFSDAELGPLFYSQRSNAYAYLQFRMAERAFSNRPDAKTARKYLFKAIRRHPKGFFENWGLSWIYLFARTWIPRPILTLARRGKRHLQRALLFRRG